MKKIIFALCLFCIASSARVQSLYFPPLTGSTWEQTAPENLGWCQENIDSLYAYLEATNTKAFLLLKDGKIVLEKYMNGFAQSDQWVWNSAAKTLTGFAVGIAQEKGLLSLNDSSSHYLGSGWTSLTPEQEGNITIRHQITMTSGLKSTGDHYCTDPECLIYAAEPGTRWSYHNAPYTLLDRVLTEATGINYDDFIENNIRQKIGMDGKFYKVGFNNIHLSTARSMARFGLLLLADGTWDGTEILGDQVFLDSMRNTSQEMNPSYGFLTWLNGKSSYMLPIESLQISINRTALPNAPEDVYMALGKDGQMINVSPSEKLIMVRMGEADGNSLVPNDYNDTIWQKINQLPCTIGLMEQELHSFQIHPNPGSDRIHLKLPEGEVVKQISILSTQGKEVELFVRPEKEVNVSGLLPGIYFIEVQTEDRRYQSKFIRM
ncbi:MAG: T9SS type A sorting domain-containing protein [Bacteroidetes bacterium]|nr:MAG: T9SS type A sorting domain-containing protein [Bacteroidota bacterium]